MIFFCLFLNVHVPVITDQFKHAIYLEHQYLVSLLIFTRTGPKQTETSNPPLFIRHMVETLWIPVSHLIEITGDYGQQRAGPGRSCFNYSQNNSGYSSRSWTPARERDNLHSHQQVAEPLSQRKDLKDLPLDKDYRELLPSQIQIFILTTLVKVQR